MGGRTLASEPNKDSNFLAPLQQQPYYVNYFLNQPPPSASTMNLQSSGGGFNLNNKVSPSILLIIIILAIIFFVSGLLHLLVRFLLRPSNRDPDELDSVTALQGQLQQLFHLHDAGVDQSFIDTLPVFSYKAIIGVKDPFDCAVCLCEFEGEDKLRLLPKCSHAFHMECIDTWLLSHSTCPLCRASLLPDFPSSSPTSNYCSPIVFVLESQSTETSREISSVPERVNSQLSSEEFRMHQPLSDLLSNKSCEIQVKETEINYPNNNNTTNQQDKIAPVEKVVQVKLGKYKNLDCVDEGSTSTSNSIDSRRCFSMGSFAYVMDDSTSLHVPIRTPIKKQSGKNKPSLPLTPGHRLARSECGWDSRREFNGLDAFKILEASREMKGIRRESFSVSKTWLRGKNQDRPNSSAKVESSRRAFSFRFPLQRSADSGEELKSKNSRNGGRRAVSEIGFDGWEENGVSDFGCDEVQSCCNSLDSQPKTPSFARRTLLWLMGRPNKVVHSNFQSNIV